MDQTRVDKGLLIDVENLDGYLENFKGYEKDMTADLASPKFWAGKRVFVTGVSGFVGSHLIEKLIEFDADVYGFIRRHSVPEYPNIAHVIERMTLVEGNLQDFDSILIAYNSIEPEVVFHLGAQSFVPTSFRCPIETYDTNIVGSANILEAARQSKADIKVIHVACSSEEYGMVYPNEVPIKETNPLRPQSPYGVSKVAVEMLSKVHHKSYGTPVKITRSFNHTGPRRGLQFVTSVVARQVARALVENKRTVRIGNPTPIRDFTDVRDMVQGYLLAIEKAKFAEPYNLGHGFGISISDLVKLTSKICGVDVRIEIDKTRFRPAEVEVLICDYSKAKKELGFRPRIPLTKAMFDNVEYFKANPHFLGIERN
ncbi:MAG: GDP-mannose 4,6-dehydratase [Candidatus Altiarchaeota archaeon]|nr:GDP-mannose 4,6-dehydratase [Candidatus Altiarchaeota archaeon]